MTGQKLAETKTVERAKRGCKRELLWLTPALTAGVFIFYVYLTTHQYPSFGAGLYLFAAEHISANGYFLPETIPNYTHGGVPFAYPPLMFYVTAVITDLLGVEPVTIARYLPGLVTLAYLVPFYLLARDLLQSRPKAALASVIVAVNPPVLQWHISAGGIVRAPALLFSLSGIYTGLRLYRSGERKWIAPSLAFFVLTVLTHPVYTLFFAMSFLLLYLEFDRSSRGFGRGLVVGLGGVVLTVPWWGQVMLTHGPDVFVAASNTHGGIGGGMPTLEHLFRNQLDGMDLLSIWQLFPLLGGAYLLVKRQFLLPAWFLLTAIVLGKARFPFLVGSLITATFLLDVIVFPLKRELDATLDRTEMVTFSVVLIATLGVSGGTLYATSHVNTHAGSPSLPQFVDHSDIEAMEWIQHNTRPTAEFVVQGDAAEWFPQQTRRTILVGPWGVEWESQARYARQLQLYRQLSTCHSAVCLTDRLARADRVPDYVYVPKGTFTVRGMQRHQSEALPDALHEASAYRLAFENDGVLVFEVVEPDVIRSHSSSACEGTRRGEHSVPSAVPC